MNRPLFEVPSPCIKVCQVDPARGLCIGCLRTLDEIAAWGDLSPREKLAVWERIAERRRGGGSPGADAT